MRFIWPRWDEWGLARLDAVQWPSTFLLRLNVLFRARNAALNLNVRDEDCASLLPYWDKALPLGVVVGCVRALHKLQRPRPLWH